MHLLPRALPDALAGWLRRQWDASEAAREEAELDPITPAWTVALLCWILGYYHGLADLTPELVLADVGLGHGGARVELWQDLSYELGERSVTRVPREALCRARTVADVAILFVAATIDEREWPQP